jgi:hypothetical protein
VIENIAPHSAAPTIGLVTSCRITGKVPPGVVTPQPVVVDGVPPGVISPSGAKLAGAMLVPCKGSLERATTISLSSVTKL